MRENHNERMSDLRFYIIFICIRYMFRKLLSFGFFMSIKGQLISMKVCSDLKCKTDCVSWNTNANSCAVCDKNKGACSITNPSSKTTTNSLTFYSDNTCTSVISGTQNMPILIGAGCNVLHNEFGDFGSYDATNLSALIGGVVGGVIVLICLCVCCCRKHRPAVVIRDVAPLPYNPPHFVPIQIPNAYYPVPNDLKVQHMEPMYWQNQPAPSAP